MSECEGKDERKQSANCSTLRGDKQALTAFLNAASCSWVSSWSSRM